MSLQWWWRSSIWIRLHRCCHIFYIYGYNFLDWSIRFLKSYSLASIFGTCPTKALTWVMIIQVKVKTKQQKSSIQKLEDGTYKISVKALPDKNKANIEIIDILSNYLNIPKSKISIQSGKTSSVKKISISE